MLNRRQLRIKALEVVYAYDKSIEKNIDFQIKYFLKSNHNFFKLYITCFSLIKELYIKANDLNSKNKKKYLNNENDISLEKFCSNIILRRIFNDDYLSQKIDDFKIDYWENHSELISSIWKEIVESDLTSKYLNDTNISFENDKSYITNLYRKIIASNKKLYEFFIDGFLFCLVFKHVGTYPTWRQRYRKYSCYILFSIINIFNYKFNC